MTKSSFTIKFNNGLHPGEHDWLVIDEDGELVAGFQGTNAAERFIARELENEDSAQEERSHYDDGPGRFEDSPRYRADMIDAGRGRLVR